jgi:phosphoribosylglycinamide formyltransferase-1
VTEVLRVGVLASGRGSNLGALLAAAARPDYPARVVVVVSDRERAPALERAATAGVPGIFLDPKDFADREAYDAALGRVLKEHRVGLVCLAGFMRILGPAFVRAWRGRLLNIHPSLLPSFPGLDPHGQALATGVKISGATVHFVIPETDAGPIVMQGAVAVADDDTAETLAQRILAIEHRIYPAALRLLASDKVRLEGDICRISEQAAPDQTLIWPAVD